MKETMKSMNEMITHPLRGTRSELFRPGMVLGLIAVALTTGCATTGGKSGSPAQDPEAAVERRAAERWQLVVDGNMHAAYEYLTPGYRSTYTANEYARQGSAAIRWIRGDIKGVECDGLDSCRATVEVRYAVTMPGAGQVTSVNLQQEHWLLSDGTWYFLPER